MLKSFFINSSININAVLENTILSVSGDTVLYDRLDAVRIG